MTNPKQLAIAIVLGTAGLFVGPHAEAAGCPDLFLGSFIGAQLVDSNSPPAPAGALVQSTAPGGSFDLAGIQPMDVVTGVDGTPCTDASSCYQLIDNPPGGTKIPFQVWDHNTGNLYNLSVTILSFLSPSCMSSRSRTSPPA